MGRFQRSWSLLQSSWGVLKEEKSLTVIPVISGFTSLMIVGLMSAGIFLTVDRTEQIVRGTTETQYTAGPVTYVIGVIGYLVLTAVVIFFTGALVSGAHQRLTGGDATLGSAFGAAAGRFPQLLLWSLLTGTVGLVLQAIKERAGFLGDIIANLVGAAWEIVTWLAVPVIIVEGTGPIASLKRSASLFKQTWGENLIAQAGFGLAGFVLMMPGILLFGVLSALVPFVGIPLLILYIVAISIVLSTLGGIYRTALYLYASTGQAPAAFGQEQMTAAFRNKKAKV